MKEKESEMERLRSSLSQAEKALAAKRERRSRRHSTGSRVVQTNGYLDVGGVSSNSRLGVSIAFVDLFVTETHDTQYKQSVLVL